MEKFVCFVLFYYYYYYYYFNVELTVVLNLKIFISSYLKCVLA